VIRPANMAMLTFEGHSALSVYRRPNISLLCTGSERMDMSETPTCGQVRNSNAYSLRARFSECGAVTRYCGAVTDNLNESKAALDEARRGSDLLITTGLGA
jgi:molybdopterin molybdotransferase